MIFILIVLPLFFFINFNFHANRNGHLNIFEIYWHRYIRLTPLLVIVVLFQSSVIKFFGDGPLWAPIVEESLAVCERDWWKLLLYVHNYHSDDYNIVCYDDPS